MFSKDSILYQVNIISKFIGIFFALLGIILLRIPGFIVLLSVILLALSISFPYTFRYSIFSVIIALVASFFPQILWISKILIFINYLILVRKLTKANDLRYILEVTLYKFQSKKITYKILYMIYFFKYMKKNHKVLGILRDEYGIKKDWFYFKFSWKKAYQKTKYEMEEFIAMNNLRFYNFSSKRSYLERPTWERWDTGYVFFHLLLLIFIILYGGIL